jgi:outer membrane immunogenic protein
MKKLLLTTAALGALALPAVAADMNPAPVYRAPVPVPVAVFTWTGCYLGGTVGGASARSTDTWAANPAPAGFGPVFGPGISGQTTGTVNASGVAGGIEGGCNYQVSPWLVLGVEADWEGTGLSGSRTGSVNVPTFVGPDGFTQSFNSHWLSTVRARAGYAAGPWLFYATGGLAVANISFSDTISFPGVGGNAVSGSTTATGWTVGGGIEWMFLPNWTVKGEYLYAQLPGTTYTSVNGVFPAATITHTHGNVQESIGRIGVNYKFW